MSAIPDDTTASTTLIDELFVWVVRTNAQAEKSRHLIHQVSGKPLCGHKAAVRALEADALAERTACPKCLDGGWCGIVHAKTVELDFSEFEPDEPEHGRYAYQEAARILQELAAWTPDSGLDTYLEGMGHSLTKQIIDADDNGWRSWSGMPTVEHPLGDLENEES